jgi:ABC-2 type transport system ATP-binding protein
MDAIVVENLKKVFKANWPWQPSTTALSGLSFTVSQGEIFGFVGPNGAGKTTTMKILLGLMAPTSGRVEMLGMPAGAVSIRRQIGFLPESPYFYDYLTAEEFVRFHGRLAGMDETELSRQVTQMIELVGLTEARSRQLRKFSKGMLQRLGLAQALIHNPRLVILDEPMSGLDPIGRKQVRDVILRLRDEGKTVFFSTHIIPDVEMICDRVAIVLHGKMLALGRVDDLLTVPHVQSVEIVFEHLDPVKVILPENFVLKVIQQGKRCLVIVPSPLHIDPLIAVIHQQEGHVVSVTPQKGSLEELFVPKHDPCGATEKS